MRIHPSYLTWKSRKSPNHRDSGNDADIREMIVSSETLSSFVKKLQ
jgi:hypothetical protein